MRWLGIAVCALVLGCNRPVDLKFIPVEESDCCIHYDEENIELEHGRAVIVWVEAYDPGGDRLDDAISLTTDDPNIVQIQRTMVKGQFAFLARAVGQTELNITVSGHHTHEPLLTVEPQWPVEEEEP